MARVIQIRDVGEDVHDALREAAAVRGLSLTKYLQLELEQLAKRAHIVQQNAAVVRDTQRTVHGGLDRQAILEAIREGRHE